MRKPIYTLLFGLLLTLWSCDNPIENIDVVLDTDDILNTTIAVELTDVAQGEPISDFADISISGPDAAMVLNLVGEREFSTAGDGLLTLILHPDAQPSASNPIEFTINANVDGYESLSKDVIISDMGNTVEILEMINYEKPPTGFLFMEQEVSLNDNGELAQELTISSNNGRIKELGFGFGINFPAGTSFTDNNGNKLFGNVKFRTRISNSSNPLGGFLRKTQEGDPYSVFADAQFSLEVTVDGVVATRTSQDFTFQINFDKNFEQSDLKVLFQKVGQDPEDLNLSHTTFDGTNVFTPVRFFGLFDFSLYNRIFRAPIASISKVPVSVSSNIVPEFGEERFYTDQYSYSITYIDPVTSEEKPFIRNRKFSFANGSNLEFNAAPGIENYKIKVHSDYDGIIGSADISANTSNNISLTFPNEAINFKLIGTCDGGDLQVGPTATIYYRPASSTASPKLLGTIQSGKMVSYKLKQGVEYEFSTRFNGSVVSAKGVINSNDYSEMRELPANICDNF